MDQQIKKINDLNISNKKKCALVLVLTRLILINSQSTRIVGSNNDPKVNTWLKPPVSILPKPTIIETFNSLPIEFISNLASISKEVVIDLIKVCIYNFYLKLFNIIINMSFINSQRQIP